MIQDACLAFIRKAEKKLNIQTWEDWYKVKPAELNKIRGHSLLYREDPYYGNALRKLYPHHDWQIWRFHQVPIQVWRDKELQTRFFRWIAGEMQFTNLEDWHRMNLTDVVSRGGKVLMKELYQDNLWNAFSSLFPDHKWKRFKLEKVHTEYWKSKEHQREFLDDLMQQLNLQNHEDWYKVTTLQVAQRGGQHVLSQYDNSMQQMISSVYTEKKFQPYRFEFVESGYWKDKTNHRKFFEDLAAHLAIKHHEDWYRVQKKDIVEFGGSSLVGSYYGDSPSKAIMAVFPEVAWQPWKFSKMPNHFLDEDTHAKELIEHAASKLGISKPEDWYSVTQQQLHNEHLWTLVLKNGGLISLLTKYYPDKRWDHKKIFFSRKIQLHLFAIVRDVFPNAQDVLANYLHPDMTYTSGKLMELDIFIPSLRLAFEYQGEQHFYRHLNENEEAFRNLIRRDGEKRQACQNLGITLVEIPYWWDHARESVIATICEARKDLSGESDLLKKALDSDWRSIPKNVKSSTAKN
eukprot:TRINITY_DN5375_c0_g1_i1.p1 TRINITY_DN5375_c0_g1~~TRINITY_DN5375_c0_g1_i1.p1  ORF type:complete len:517 (-),score=158.27 TRINITY_DN5375_c0_g1_i1:2205-3755(-)